MKLHVSDNLLLTEDVQASADDLISLPLPVQVKELSLGHPFTQVTTPQRLGPELADLGKIVRKLRLPDLDDEDHFDEALGDLEGFFEHLPLGEGVTLRSRGRYRLEAWFSQLPPDEKSVHLVRAAAVQDAHSRSRVTYDTTHKPWTPIQVLPGLG